VFAYVLNITKTCYLQTCTKIHVKTLKDFFTLHKKTFTEDLTSSSKM